jgi:hypothetical protein
MPPSASLHLNWMIWNPGVGETTPLSCFAQTRDQWVMVFATALLYRVSYAKNRFRQSDIVLS